MGDTELDGADVVEFLSKAASSSCPGDDNGEGSPLFLESSHGWVSAVNGGCRVGERRRGDSDGRPFVDARGVKLVLRAGSEGGILTGSGNRGPLFFLRLGRRKNVVVVETVWVVVVAYTWSPKLPSDLEDSESLEIGNAREEVDSSP